MERSPAHTISAGGIGAAGEKGFDESGVAAFDGEVEWRAERGIRRVDVGAAFEEERDDVGLLAEDGLMEREHFPSTGSADEYGLCGEQALHLGGIAFGDGGVERGGLGGERPGEGQED
jgi:hypothetical protein